MSRRSTGLRFRPWRHTAVRPNHKSLWIEQALSEEKDEAPSVLRGRVRADVCVVGGGFTGLWRAIRLRELDPGLRVVLIEADLCGTGASGRNGGAVSHWWGKLPTLARLLGREEATAIVKASVGAVEDLGAFCRAHGIDCGFRPCPSIWSATSRAQLGAWNRVLKTAGSLDVEPPYRELSRHELERLVPGGRHLAGVMDESARRVQPAALARGLRSVAIRSGIEIFERSPVERVASTAEGLKVGTSDGELAGDKIVLAANAWMAHLRPFRRSIMVVSSDVVATEPLPERLGRLSLGRAAGFNARLMVNYYGPSLDHRLIFGRGGGTLAPLGRIGAAFDHSERQAREVRRDLELLFPELSGVSITHAWAGPVDRSVTGLPSFGRLPEDDRIHYGIGYSGHGVGASVLGGRILASLVLGRDDQWTALGRSLQRAQRGRFPPEPARSLGGFLVRGAVARKENKEARGERATRLDVALARLAPATMSDVSRDPPPP